VYGVPEEELSSFYAGVLPTMPGIGEVAELSR
jgi:hypothetical protein